MRALRRLGVVALVALALSGCTLVSPNAAPRNVAKSIVPFGLLHRTIPGTNGKSVHFTTQPVFLVDITKDLAPSSRIVPSPAALETVIQQLLIGPTAIEQSAGYSSSLPKDLILLRASVRGGVGYIDVASALSTLPTSQQLLAVGQLVLTAEYVGATSGIEIDVRGVAQSLLTPSGRRATLVSAKDFAKLVNG